MMNDTALRQMAAVNATVSSGNNISRYGHIGDRPWVRLPSKVETGDVLGPPNEADLQEERRSAALLTHTSDPEILAGVLGRWQSGVYYPDDTPKSSLAAVRTAADAARAGTLVPNCPR